MTAAIASSCYYRICSWIDCNSLASLSSTGSLRFERRTFEASRRPLCWLGTCLEIPFPCRWLYSGGQWTFAPFAVSRKLPRSLCRCLSTQSSPKKSHDQTADEPRSRFYSRQALCSSLWILCPPDNGYNVKLTRMSCWVGIDLSALTANWELFRVCLAFISEIPVLPSLD